MGANPNRMDKRGPQRRTKISGQFAARLIEMLESPAFRVLSHSALRVLHRLEIELAHHGGLDNGNLPVTYDDFEEYGIDRHAVAPAVRETVALGFVEITEQGRAGNAAWRTPSKYRLTYRHSKGAPDDGTHEWRQIKTIEDAKRIAKAARETPRMNIPAKNAPAKEISQWGKTPISSGRN